MNRSVVGVVAALVLGLGLAAVFWLTAPSVEPTGSGPAAADEDPEQRARRVAEQRKRQADALEAGEDRVGAPAIRAEDQPEVDPETVGKSRKDLDSRGGLRRMRALMQSLEAVPDEPVPEGATPAEEDRILAAPIAKKMRILEDMQRDALIQGRGENETLGARSQLLLAEGYDHMAGWLRDRPVPSYLDDEGRGQFLDALEERALHQEERAAQARDAAREHAASLPADHPIHDRLR